jgi:uncharacterized protein (TIGR00299 family) protein
MSDLLFEMHTGVSGDMILGGLFDLGLDFKQWKKQIKRLGLPQIKVAKETVSSQGIRATKVTVSSPKEKKHRSLSDITKIIKKSEFSDITESRIIEIFSTLAEVEAKIHGCDIQSIRFHELGGLDTILDVAGACIGFEMLSINDFYCTPFTFGTGEIHGGHGRLPVPAPATVELAKGFPVKRTDIEGELCTPTGTAIISHLAVSSSELPVYTIQKNGYGAGTRKISGRPNVLRLSIIEKIQEPNVYANDEVFQVECNLDDLSPQILASLTQQLLKIGCNDAWQESIYMKKNRAGVKLCCLVSYHLIGEALGLIASETTAGGMRYFPVKRTISGKSSRSVKTKYGEIKVKKIRFPKDMGNIVKLTPEYESCKIIAQRNNIPLQQVFQEAISNINKEK